MKHTVQEQKRSGRLTKYAFFISVFFVFVIIHAGAQPSSSFKLTGGYGFYEGYSVGTLYSFKNQKSGIGLSAGIDRFWNNQLYYAFTAEHNLSVFRSAVNIDQSYKWFLCTKAVFWNYHDAYYTWRVVSAVPSLGRHIILSSKLKMAVDAGIAINFVVYNKRKTFEEVGWPYHVLPNMRILFIY